MAFKRIHILVVARWPVGGIRTFFRYVYRKFPEDRFKFTFILPETSEHDALVRDFRSFTNVSFIKLVESPGFKDFFKAILFVNRKDRVHLIHSHGFTAGIYSILPSKFLHIPHLMTSHDVFTQKQFSGLSGRTKRLLLTNFLKMINFIHCVSNDARNNLLQFLPGLDGIGSRIVSIRNGIEVERFLTEEQEDLREELGLTANTFLIGFFGRFMSQKGFKYLAGAMELLRDKQLPQRPVVVCFGWGGFIREEQEYLRSKGIIDDFYFLPFRENIAPALRGLDVVAMPSLWEAYGLLAAEALVAGVPVIGSDCIGLREVLNDTPARIVPAGNAAALAETIESEMSSPSRDEACKFREMAAERFDAKTQAVQLQNLVFNCVLRERTKNFLQ